jgi:hypothetical protein
MPGLEPEDISVTITDQLVTIIGRERGPGQHDRALAISEWSVGPYFREIDLGRPVSGHLTNATYGNGVLVLAMPDSKDGETGATVSFQLSAVGATRGERIGHEGSDIRPLSDAEHKDKQHKSEAARH